MNFHPYFLWKGFMHHTESCNVRRSFDVDIDVCSDVDRGSIGTRAIVYNEENKKILPHPSGVYLEKVPVDLLTGNASFDYKQGDALGYFKVDILTNTSYDSFKTKKEVLECMEKEPSWDLLHKLEVVEKLPHVAKHFEMLKKISPTSVESLADCLALIRPGKAHLVDEYLEDPDKVRPRLYTRPKEGIYFKKSHAISYALMIVCVLNKVHDVGILW